MEIVKDKILHILYGGMGGHGSVVTSIITADKEQKYQHQLLFYGIEDVNTNYIHFAAEHQLKYQFVQKKRGIDIKSYLTVWQKLKLLNPDTILVNSMTLIWLLIVYGFIYRKKIIAVEHNDNTIKTKHEWLCSALACLFAYNVVYLTQKYKEEVKKKLKIIFKEKKTIVINNGIDLEKFKPNELNNKQNNIIIIGMQSRFTPIRDHKTLIDAIKLINDKKKNTIKLELAGIGETFKEIKKYIEEQQLNNTVQLLGNLDESNLILFLNRLDLYVHSSLAENLSTAVIQAMACRKPIIATNIPGINNLIKDGNTGILFEPKNVNDLTRKLESLIEDKNQRKQISKKALDYAQQHFSSKKMFDQYATLIN